MMDDADQELGRGDEPVRDPVCGKSPDCWTQLKHTYTEFCLGPLDQFQRTLQNSIASLVESNLVELPARMKRCSPLSSLTNWGLGDGLASTRHISLLST